MFPPKKNFQFRSNRYEEWQAGQCISQGSVDVLITAEANGDGLHVELTNIGNLRIVKSFSFEKCDILPDRVQFVHGSYDFNPIVPFVCHIFYNGTTISYVRFAMTNPDRLIEFYGCEIEYKPIIKTSLGSEETYTFSAEKTIQELKSYGMLNTAAIMERAVPAYNSNSNIVTIENGENILECLKLFVKAYQMEKAEKKVGISLIPKILMFISLCNYKIYNINQAYCVAKQGLDAIGEIIEKSCLSFPKEILGADTLEEIVNIIEQEHFSEITNRGDYYNIDPTNVDSSKLNF